MKKKLLSLVLALVMCLGLTVPAFAAPVGSGAGVSGDRSVPKEERLKADVILEGYLRTEYVKMDENSFWAVQVVKDGSKVKVECPGVEQLVDKERSLDVLAYEYVDTGLYGFMWWDCTADFLDGVGYDFQVDTSSKTFAATLADAPEFIFAIKDAKNNNSYPSYVEVEESVYWMSESGYAQLAPEHKGVPGAGSKIEGVVGPDKSTQPTVPTVGGFTDVKTGDYFAEPVQWAVEKKITAGTSATTFSPNATCTQGQILTFLWRAKDELKPVGTVSGTQYYAAAAQWAKEQGLTDNFSAESDCTRAMVVTYLWKLAGSPKTGTSNFSDVPANANYAQAVAWAVEQGITSGIGNGQFDPNSTCTRGQIVTFLYRAFVN